MTPTDVLSASATRSRLVESGFRLGEWVVFPKLNSVARNGATVHLEPKVMQVLTCLAESGDIVSKETLMRTVWTDTFVTDDVLTRSISELRKVFADDPKRPHYIQTIPKSGYRLLVPTMPVLPEKVSSSTSPGLPQVPVAPSAAMSNVWRRRLLAIILLGAGAAVALAAVTYFKGAGRVKATVKPTDRNMLAVVPFQNLNNDPEHDYYSDGLTAEMISQFGRLPSDRLGVIAWNSMIRYKGTRKSEDEIAGELGANYVLEGTVRRSGGQIRITAELVHIGNRSHIWANSYDGDLGEVLAFQTRVAREIASEIQLRLTPEQEARLGNTGPVNPEGYTIYLRSKFSIKRNTDAGFREMIERLQESIRLNPNYAPPYVGVAVAYRQLASEGFAPASAYAKANQALEKALQIDPFMSEAHSELGWTEWRGYWNFATAEAEFRRALELGPGYGQAHGEYSLYLKSMGRFSEALTEVNAAMALDPMEAYTQANAGHLLGLLHRYDEAEQHFRKALDLGFNLAYVHERYGAVLLWEDKKEQAISEFEKAVQLSDSHPEKLAWLAYAYAVNNQKKEASGLLARLLRLPAEKRYVSPFHIALIYTGLGDSRNALHWLREAYSQHDEWLVYLRVYPEFQGLRSERDFVDLERRIGLIQ